MKIKKFAIKYGLAVIIFCAVFVTAGAIKAGVSQNVSGWIWGGSEESDDRVVNGNETGIGWISMNSSNCDTDNDGKSEGIGFCPPAETLMANYGVDIPLTNGDLRGSAWSENLGYIDFDPHSGCPGSPKYPGACDPYPAASPTTDAMRSDNKIIGWARFVEIAKASIPGVNNSGGWLGWIALSDTNPNDGINYGVSIDGDGKLSGNAWSDELGYIKFNGTAGNGSIYGAILPSMEFWSNPGFINIETNPNWKTSGVGINLGWKITGNTSCTKSADNGVPWTGTVNADGDVTVTQNKASVTYKLTCTGGAGETEIIIKTGCYTKTCTSQKCGNNILMPGETDLSACTAASSCTTDADCQTKSVDTWKEVAP